MNNTNRQKQMVDLKLMLYQVGLFVSLLVRPMSPTRRYVSRLEATARIGRQASHSQRFKLS